MLQYIYTVIKCKTVLITGGVVSMEVKTIEKWTVIMDKENSDVLFENYLYGFPAITHNEKKFETVRVFVVVDSRDKQTIKNIMMFPWSKGETYTGLHIIPKSLKKDIVELVNAELMPQVNHLIFQNSCAKYA